MALAVRGDRSLAGLGTGGGLLRAASPPGCLGFEGHSSLGVVAFLTWWLPSAGVLGGLLNV